MKLLAIDATHSDPGFYIGKHLMMFEDRTSELTSEEILSPQYLSQFVASERDVPNLGYSASAYWFILLVDNQTSEDISRVLAFHYYPLQSIEVYADAGMTYNAGNKLAIDGRTFRSATHAVELRIVPGLNQYLIRIQSDSTLSIPITLSASKDYHDALINGMVIKGAFVGFFVVLILYNLFVGFSVGEKAYFWYVGYLLGFTVFFLAQTGFGHYYLWPFLSGESTMMQPVAIAIVASFSLQFTRAFLNIKKLGRFCLALYRALFWVSLVCLFVAFFAPYRVAISVAILCVMIFVLGIIVIAVIAIAKGMREARWYLLSWITFLLGSMLQALNAYDLIGYGFLSRNTVFVGAAVEGLLLSFALADRFRLVKEATNQSLAAAVAERTLSLRETLAEVERQKYHAESAKMQFSEQLHKVNMLLDNAGEGFLSIAKDLAVDNEYSQECLRLFGRDEINGSIIDLIKQYDASVALLMEKTFNAVLSTEMNQDLMETYLSLLPTHMVIRDRFCEIRYRVMAAGHEGADRKLMLILTDQTDKKQAEEAFETEKKNLQLIVYALGHRDEFLQVWRGFNRLMTTTIPALLNGELSEGDSFSDRFLEVYRLIHTYKGSLYQSHCYALGDQLHALESKLALIDKDSQGALACAAKAMKGVQIMKAVEGVRETLINHLGDNYFADHELYQIHEKELAEIESLVKSNTTDVEVILRRLDHVRHEPFDKLLKPHINFLVKAAKSRGFKLAPIDISCSDVYVDPKKYQHLIHCLAHLFRNALDHGFDTEEERLDANKFGQVKFSCSAEFVDEQIQIIIQDDGRGIATDVLRHRAVERGLISLQEAQAMSHKEALQLVFVDGLSSAVQVSHTAGRGVGMAALKDEVIKLDGQIMVASEKNEGTCWTIALPRR